MKPHFNASTGGSICESIYSNMGEISSDLVSYSVCYLLAVSSEVPPAVSPSASLFYIRGTF